MNEKTLDKRSRTVLFSISSNTLLLVVKLLTGIFTGSVSVLSEAVHSATDLVASVGYIATGFSDLFSLAPLVVGSIAGAWLGVRLRDWLPEKAIRVGFACLMVVVALRTLGDATGIL